MTWPLMRDDLAGLETLGLRRVDLEDFWDRHEGPPTLSGSPVFVPVRWGYEHK
jgi:hypothetical protein